MKQKLLYYLGIIIPMMIIIIIIISNYYNNKEFFFRGSKAGKGITKTTTKGSAINITANKTDKKDKKK